jgi:hypothetical protein
MSSVKSFPTVYNAPQTAASYNGMRLSIGTFLVFIGSAWESSPSNYTSGGINTRISIGTDLTVNVSFDSAAGKAYVYLNGHTSASYRFNSLRSKEVGIYDGSTYFGAATLTGGTSWAYTPGNTAIANARVVSDKHVVTTYVATPLMLHLNGDGIHTLAKSAGVTFGVKGDGARKLT